MAWYALPLSASAGAHLPPLLLSTAFTASSFTVHLTDLTYIWSETLTRAEIVQRSREEGTSIDPSETGQLKIFLEKIKLGLAGGKGTTLALTINGDPDRPSLVLSVSVNLPGGLQPLRWSVRLSAAPQALLTSQLTMPLLQTHHVHMQEMAGLIDALKDKDHVIQKLLDKLEEQGTELGQIFPQAAGKVGRKVDRKKAEEKVRGIARFDVDAWRQGLNYEQPEEKSKLIGEIFSSQIDNASSDFPAANEEQESWWEDIKGLTVQLDSGKISTKGPSNPNKSTPQPTLNKDETQQEDDAFQTQSTPPPVATRSKSPPSKSALKSTKIGDSTNEDDDDLDGPSQSSRVPDSVPASPPPPSFKPTKKLGGLGKKKVAHQHSPPVESNDDEDEKGSAEETTSRKSSPTKQRTTSPTPESISVPHRPQKKLGKLGGAKKVAPPAEPEPEPGAEPQHSSTEDDAEPEQEKGKEPSLSPPPAHSLKAKKGKLGSLGRKKNTVAASTSASVDQEGDPDAEPASTPPTSTPPESHPGSNATTPKRKLGGLRGSKKTKKEDGVKEEESSQRGRGSSPVEKEVTKTPEPRETSLERADRKRAELKRELEEKAKAPVKKKRKF
ncbi:hypothetical protein ONS96_013930 [Cadophora gregata f. sp. sojae]|nr:hypothetical protein ONS96_013930 [Cadophora gregata f. sp. sojae]